MQAKAGAQDDGLVLVHEAYVVNRLPLRHRQQASYFHASPSNAHGCAR